MYKCVDINRKHTNYQPKEVVIFGAGGHGKVIADIIEKSGDRVIGFLDDKQSLDNVLGYPIIGQLNECIKFKQYQFFIAIGNNKIRKMIADRYCDIKYYTAIHPSSCIANNVCIGEGTCIMANAIINSSTHIGNHCIINSGAVVEHDNIICNYVHISPSATLCGTVKVAECTHIGAAAVVKNNITITRDCTIGAGAVVVNNINKKGIYVGIPAKIM